jgi:hypothetical protein
VINPVFIQGIGLVALLIGTSVFQVNNRKTMLLLGMGASLLWSVHYLLLAAPTGVAMNILGASRGYIYHRTRPTKQNRWILWTLICVTMAATVLTWQGIISLLALIGSLGNVIAYWQTKPKYIRRLALISSPSWLTYNAISGSYPGVVAEILSITSNLLGQYRFDFKRISRRNLLNRWS